MSIFLTKQKIIKDWTDYNGHMNVAYYVLIFDQFGSEVLLTSFNMGEESAKTTKKSTMVVESHITYDQEVKENDEVDINLIYCDHDKKRIQYKLEMIHSEKKYLAATLEALSLYVDLDERKVVEFEKEKVDLMKEFISKNNITFKTDNLKFSSKLKK
jgi:acyl-CoA thioester hydrolase